MIRKRLSAAFGLLVALAGVWGACLLVVRAARSPSRADARFAAAEQVVFYRLEPGEAVRLRLPLDADAVRVMTHLLLPPGSTFEADRQYVYGMHFKLVDADYRALIERALYTRTRQSKAEPVEGSWAKQSAFTVDPREELTDGRDFWLELPSEALSGRAWVELHNPSPTGALLVRAYARTHGADWLGARRLSSERTAASKADRATFVPFEKLPGAAREALRAVAWQRLGAEGEAGLDYRTERVYRTDFRLPLVEVAEASQERLAAGHSVVVNALGPAELTLRVWGTDATSVDEGKVRLTIISGDGSSSQRALTVPAVGELATRPLKLGAGVHSLRLDNETARELHYLLEGPPAQWLVPDAMKPPPEVTVAPLLPHRVRSEAWVSGPGCPALELELEPSGPPEASLLRIDARVLAPGGEQETPRLTVEVLDARGRKLSTGDLPLAAAPAALELAERVALPNATIPCGDPDEAAPGKPFEPMVRRELGVSEAVSTRLIVARGARRVRIRASAPAALRLSTFLEPRADARAAAPYDAGTLRGTRWRNAAMDDPSWHPLRPWNHLELSELAARVELVGQVHLEQRGVGGSGRSGREAVVLVPWGRPTTLEVLEPQSPDTELDPSRELLTWLEPGRPVRVRFDERGRTRPELRLRLDDPAALGREFAIEVDGATVHRGTLRTTRGRALLPPIPPGEHELVVRADMPGLRVMLNRPAVSDAALRPRTLYRLDGRTLRIPVRKHTTGAMTLNVMVYARSATASESTHLNVVIDDGRPKRREALFVGRITPPRRTVALPASDRPAATSLGADAERLHPRRVPVTLGADLAPGLHWVELSSSGGAPMWTRFFVYRDSESDAPEQWTRPGWDAEDGG